jgi:hypothetical protein
MQRVFSVSTQKPKIFSSFLFVGYNPKLATVGNEVYLKISLTILVNELDEVVTTGYTSQRIKEIAGSVAVVKPKDLVSVPAGHVEQMLQDELPVSQLFLRYTRSLHQYTIYMV